MSVEKLPNADFNAFSAALKQLKANYEEICEYQITLAQIRSVSYKAHITSGFSEEQALALCQNIT